MKITFILAALLAFPVPATAVISDAAFDDFHLACVAAAAQENAGSGLLIGRVWKDLRSQTCGANIIFERGGRLQPAAGQNLQLTGNLDAGLGQIFDVSQRGAKITGFNAAAIYPQWWGAVADDVHDDAPAIQAAIDEAISAGIQLSLPAGTYLCNAAVGGAVLNILSNKQNMTMPPDRHPGGLTIRGDGIGRTIIRTETLRVDLIAAVSSDPHVYYPHYDLRDFTLMGPDVDPATCPSKPGFGGNGIRITGTNGSAVSIQSVYASGFCGAGSAAIWLDNAEEFDIGRLFLMSSDVGLKITGASNASVATGVVAVHNHSFGLYIESSASIAFNSILVQSNFGTGAFINGLDNSVWNAAHFENNNMSASIRHYGLHLERANNNVFNSFGSFTAHDNIFIDGSPGHPSTNNYFLSGDRNGFQAGAKIILNNAYATGNIWAGFDPSVFEPSAENELILNTNSPGVAGPVRSSFPIINAPLAVNGRQTADSEVMLRLGRGTSGASGSGNGIGVIEMRTPEDRLKPIIDAGGEQHSTGLSVLHSKSGSATKLCTYYNSAGAVKTVSCAESRDSFSWSNFPPQTYSQLVSCAVAGADGFAVAYLTDLRTTEYGSAVSAGAGKHKGMVACIPGSSEWQVLFAR